jgi:hypothetical protein
MKSSKTSAPLLAKNCLKLPWTELDNPNGWIEPTTFCNIACPGCYRGIDKPEHKSQHLELDEVKNQIDWFRTKRNVHTISIAGGEPLMYPHILEAITYAAKANLRVMLYTNGVLLDKAMALRLAEAGLTQVVVHIDRFQSRPDLAKDEHHMALRERFVDIFREIPSLRLGFIQPISADCNGELHSVMDFLERNIDIVNLMVFTLYRNICWSDPLANKLNTDISISDVVENIRRKYIYKPTAYLGSSEDDSDITWLFAQRVGLPGKIFGYFSPSFYKFAHMRYRKKSGRHLFISRINSIKFNNLLRFFVWGSVSKILLNYKKYIPKKPIKKDGTLYFQTLLIIRGPEKGKSHWDLCKGCPDRMIYKGKLVPSCILEDLKKQDMSNYTTAN